MPISCGYCGVSMPDVAEFCPSCGRPTREGNVFVPEETPEAPVPARPVAVLPPVDWNDRLIGASAYLTLVPAVVFIFLKPFQQRKFIRFHAFQSLFFWGAVIVFIMMGLLASMFGWLFLWMLTGAVIGLGLCFTWLLLCIKALQGERFELPWLGPLAGEQAERYYWQGTTESKRA